MCNALVCEMHGGKALMASRVAGARCVVSWCQSTSITGAALMASRQTVRRVITTLCRIISAISAVCSISSRPASVTTTPDSELSSCMRPSDGRRIASKEPERRYVVDMDAVTACRPAERVTPPVNSVPRHGSVDR